MGYFLILLSSVALASNEIKTSVEAIFKNLAVPMVARGAVIASPSEREPDYFYHWSRDAALTMETLWSVRREFPQATRHFREWLKFEHLALQNSHKGVGLGEPKFLVSGEVFSGPWGRPQNDGPAIRVWTLLKAYKKLTPMVREDLAYLHRHWREPSFDLWEEVKGHHFFTRYAQMAAFRDAAALALTQGETNLAKQYADDANAIAQSLNSFVDFQRFIIVPTLSPFEGIGKPAGLDISIVLAVIYFGSYGEWSVSHSYVIATALRLEETFKKLYGINRMYAELAPAIGRYPEDVYDGNGFSQGHPWFLATFAMAEFYCALSADLSLQHKIDVISANALRTKARSYIDRALFHGGADRQYSEQFDRDSGYRRGARDLTWSYAASIRAFKKCNF